MSRGPKSSGSPTGSISRGRASVRTLLSVLLGVLMSKSNPQVVGAGIGAGPTFVLGHLVYITNANPPQVSSFGPTVVTDSLSSVVYLNIPDSTSSSVPGNQNATETIRINGGMIVQGPGTDSVAIGRGASASIATGSNGADTIAIGRGIIGGSVTTNRIAIGALANYSGGGSVVIGYNAGSGSANPVSGVFIGSAAQASGNAGGASVVCIGESALIVLGSAGGGGAVAIGTSALVDHPGAVVIGRAAQASGVSTASQNTVTIGDGATSTRFGTTVIGGAASTTQFTSTVIGSGASVTLSAASPSVGSIVIGQTATTSKAGCIVIGTASALTSTASACIGHGCVDMGANVLQFGGPSASYDVIVLGAGDTIATPSAKGFRFTNGSGADNAAGNFTLQAPLSTGNATPASIILTVGVQVAGSSSTLQTATAALTLANATATGHLATFGGFIRTATPNGGTAANWKLGTYVAAAVTADGNYVEVDVGGTLRKLMTGV